jgi:hypothetical protein
VNILADGSFAAPLGLRNLDQIYFLPLVVLLVLLLEREMIRAAGGPRARAVIRILDMAAFPLLIAFLIMVALRLNQVLTHS